MTVMLMSIAFLSFCYFGLSVFLFLFCFFASVFSKLDTVILMSFCYLNKTGDSVVIMCVIT